MTCNIIRIIVKRDISTHLDKACRRTLLVRQHYALCLIKRLICMATNKQQSVRCIFKCTQIYLFKNTAASWLIPAAAKPSLNNHNRKKKKEKFQ